MYIKQAFVLSVAVLLPMALADVTCQTTDGSPKLSDVTDLINYLHGKNQDFGPDVFASSGCTTVAKVEGAAVAICDGDAGYTGPGLAKHALDIQNACLNNDRVGGTKKIGSSKVEIIHS